MANRVAGEQTVLLRKAGRVINPPMKKLDRMPTHAEFAHVTDWVFDLDNTLYPHHVNLFSQIDRNMTAYVAELLSLELRRRRSCRRNTTATTAPRFRA